MLSKLIIPGSVTVLLINRDQLYTATSQILGWPEDELGDITVGDNLYDTGHGRVRIVNFTDEMTPGVAMQTSHRRQTYLQRAVQAASKSGEAVIIFQTFTYRKVEQPWPGYHYDTNPSKTLFLGRLGMAVVEGTVVVFRNKVGSLIAPFPFLEAK